MAESQLKRQREHHHDHEEKNDDYSKRHKSYTDILSILEQEEDEPNQDLSDIFTSLQQELSSSSSSSSSSYDSTAVDKNSSCVGCGSGFGSDAESVHETCCGGGGVDDAGNNVGIEVIEEDERVRVMRHLLEASDDELGIPNRVEESGEEENESGEQKQQQQLFLSGDWKWQFEDDAANYYTFMELQSELFI